MPAQANWFSHTSLSSVCTCSRRWLGVFRKQPQNMWERRQTPQSALFILKYRKKENLWNYVKRGESRSRFEIPVFSLWSFFMQLRSSSTKNRFFFKSLKLILCSGSGFHSHYHIHFWKPCSVHVFGHICIVRFYWYMMWCCYHVPPPTLVAVSLINTRCQ